MKYIVTVEVTGQLEIEIEADNPRDAKYIATYKVDDADLNNLDNICALPVDVADEGGTVYDV